MDLRRPVARHPRQMSNPFPSDRTGQRLDYLDRSLSDLFDASHQDSVSVRHVVMNPSRIGAYEPDSYMFRSIDSPTSTVHRGQVDDPLNLDHVPKERFILALPSEVGLDRDGNVRPDQAVGVRRELFRLLPRESHGR